MHAPLILLLTGVGSLTLIAAITDYRSRRIPNKLTVPYFVAGLVYQAAFNQWSGLADAGLAFALGFGGLFILWMIGGGGGGDVKLIGALSVWLGLQLTIRVMIASTLLVILFSVSALVASTFRRGFAGTRNRYTAQGSKQALKNLTESIEARQQRRIIAYAIPVAFATWAVMVWKMPTL